MEAAWVVYADALTDASTAQTIATANAYSAAVGRWAGQEGGAYAAMTAAVESAKATRTGVQATSNATYQKTSHAADAAWVATVLPAWVTYEGALSDHSTAWVATAAPAWETKANAETDADLTYTTAAVPLGVALDAALSTHITTWLGQTVNAEAAYGNAQGGPG